MQSIPQAKSLSPPTFHLHMTATLLSFQTTHNDLGVLDIRGMQTIQNVCSQTQSVSFSADFIGLTFGWESNYYQVFLWYMCWTSIKYVVLWDHNVTQADSFNMANSASFFLQLFTTHFSTCLCSIFKSAPALSILPCFIGLSSSSDAPTLHFPFSSISFLGNKRWSMVLIFCGTMFISGAPVIWHRHPLGRDTKIDVSNRRCSIASIPILLSYASVIYSTHS